MFRSTNSSAIPLALAALLASNCFAQLTVAAAAELKPALEEVRRIYTERTGNPLRTMYLNPAEVVKRASQGGIDAIILPGEWIDTAKARNLSAQAPSFIATSPMALWSRQGKPLPDAQLQFLLDTTIHGIVMSDPALSPDGARVRPFLHNISADTSFTKRIVVATEPAAAIETILADKADAAILPQSAIWSSPVSGMGRQLIVDSVQIAPQRTMSLVLNVSPDRQQNARDFLDWVVGPQAKGIWRRNGFLMP